MKKASPSVPVYDLHTINPARLHHDISAGSFADYYQICGQLAIPHKHNFYQVVLVTNGTGTATIDYGQFDILPDQVFFVVPGQVNSWSFKNKPSGYAINFSEKIFHSYISSRFYLEQFPFLRGIPGNSVIDLKKETTKEIINFIKQIINEVKKKDTFSTDIICLNLISLFVSITRNNSLSPHRRIPEQNQLILHNFRMLVDQYYIDKRLPKEYAAMLCLTPGQLNAVCKDLLGKSAGNLIRDRILLEAKRLLVNTNISISEIAYQIGFSDNSYFTKFFKKYTAVTPEEFRK